MQSLVVYSRQFLYIIHQASYRINGTVRTEAVRSALMVRLKIAPLRCHFCMTTPFTQNGATKIIKSSQERGEMGDKQYETNNYTEFFYKAFRNILTISIPLAIISVLVLSLPHSSADSSSDTIKLSVPVSCTLSSRINTGEEHTISMVAGTYEHDIGTTTLTTSCNDPGGFVIYANGNTDDIAGNNKLTSILGATYDIPSGTATSGDISQWAMKLTAVSSATPADTPTIATGYDSYSAVPNQWTKVVYKDAGTMNVETGSSFTTTYAIYLKGTQPAGIYTGQVKYVMLHPSSTGAPASTINEAFANANKTPVSILDPETGEYSNFYKMQDMNTGICESVAGSNESTTARLVDIRDNKLYYVTKLDDGHCWMTQNLDLDLSRSTTLTSETTDLNDNSLTGAYENGYAYDSVSRVISWVPAESATTVNFEGTSVASWSNNGSNPPRSANKTDDNGMGHASLGNYYNWSAAIASNAGTSFATNTYNDVNNNPQNSICPKGWRLPTISNANASTINSTNEFARLNYLYNDNLVNNDASLISSPLWFIRAGIIDTGTKALKDFSSSGFYLSSTNQSIWDFAYLKFNSERVSPNNRTLGQDGGKYYGWSIRCLAR